jgi:hypothetical protein
MSIQNLGVERKVKLKCRDKCRPKKRFTPIERAKHTRKNSENVSVLLNNIGVAANDPVVMALAARIDRCSLKTNHYFAEDISDKFAECFDGFGSLWGCGSRFCNSCLRRNGAKNRQTALTAMKETPLMPDEMYRLITLTMPKIKVRCLKSLKILGRVWELFRKRKFFLNYISGCVKNGEFTVREDDTYHSHLHLLAISKFIPEAEIKMEWKYCVKKAFEEFGLDYDEATINVTDKDKLNVNIKLVSSWEEALNECTKYLTKNESWSMIPESHLLELASVERFPRMFELIGCLKTSAQAIKKKLLLNTQIAKELLAESLGKASTSDYFNTNGLTDGELEINQKPRRENWRKYVLKFGLEKYIYELDKQVTKTIEIRQEFLMEKYSFAKFSDLTGFCWHSPPPTSYNVEECSPEAVSAWENSQEFKFFEMQYLQRYKTQPLGH